MSDLDPNREYWATTASVLKRCKKTLMPPPILSLSQWADEHFYLSPESSAQSGRWTTLPYQKGMMDAVTDPKVTQISCMKSARIGWTKILNAAIGYFIHQSPCSILLVQPTIEDSKGYSKEEIAPMLRDCPVLQKIIFQDSEEKGPKDSGNTILSKAFPGGVLSMIGANSGTGFRRVSRRVVAFDEVDAYPMSAGSDGDPIKLGIKRTEYFHDRKILAGSTPLIAGASRIQELFESGDQRKYYVPCPSCGHMDFLVFTERDTGGHYLVFDKRSPKDAHFVCSKNGCVIEHKDKRQMVERGEWRASKPFEGHASFHIWAAYSYSPNATWGHLAEEFLAAKAGGREQLKTFINTALGECWKESGDAPEWERLYQRREQYRIGSVPKGVKFLTAGVDVQKDRWVYEVVGWGRGKTSWSIDAGEILGDTSNETEWAKLDELLERTYDADDGTLYTIRTLAVDSGYNTQMVYGWGRRHDRGRVMAVKGVSTARTLIGTPTPVDVSFQGKKISRGYRVWPVGVDIGKSELYGFLRLQPPTAESGLRHPPGFCHFPEHGEEFFRQLTGEHLVSTVSRSGRAVHEWCIIPGRQNHALDARNYARAAAAVLGLDRMAPSPEPEVAPVKIEEQTSSPPEMPPAPRQPVPVPPKAKPPPPKHKSPSKYWGNRAKSWLKR